MTGLIDRENVTVRLPKAYLNKISDVCKQEGVSRSRLIESIVENYIVNDHKNKDLSKLLNSINVNKVKKITRSKTKGKIKDAVLIAGGIGSRLSPYTDEIVKPLVPIQGKPVIEHLVELFRHYGVENIYFSICYKKDQLKNYFGDGSEYGMNFYYLEKKKKKPMGTAYAMRLLKRHFNDRPFYMTNSDELKDIDLNEFSEFYFSKKDCKACIALTKVEDPSQYGVAKMNSTRIAEFVEKPKKGKAPSNLINSGLYIIHPSVMEMVPNEKTMTENKIFPVLAKNKELYGFKFDGQWFDTGTPARYKLAIDSWKGFSWAKK